MSITVIEIAAFIAVAALMIFLAFKRSVSNRNANKRERLHEKQEELMET
ncbi:MAG: hypothetical protein ABI861_01750 [Panacibacter sp.]